MRILTGECCTGPLCLAELLAGEPSSAGVRRREPHARLGNISIPPPHVVEGSYLAGLRDSQAVDCNWTPCCYGAHKPAGVKGQ